jgi:hypothetical protein
MLFYLLQTMKLYQQLTMKPFEHLSYLNEMKQASLQGLANKKFVMPNMNYVSNLKIFRTEMMLNDNTIMPWLKLLLNIPM